MGFENEKSSRLKPFEGFQLNRKLFGLAKPTAIVMHCLPMVKGEEITEEMVEHSQSVLFQQAANRLHAQKALLAGLFASAIDLQNYEKQIQSLNNVYLSNQDGSKSNVCQTHFGSTSKTAAP